MPNEYYLWLDLETTGLNPDSDFILEVGAFLMDKNSDRIYGNPIDYLVKNPDGWENLMDDYVREMHTKNGLIKSINHTNTLYSNIEIEDKILNLMKLVPNSTDEYLNPIDSDNVFYLAGSSVHFDRTFIKKYMPKLDKALSHRHMDTSALKLFFDDVRINVERQFDSAHRALDDAKYSYYRYRMFKNVVGSLIEKECNL